uniref:G-protein coupled receptors family 1 profile domain-containing protein n=1 Tax=Nannospalax galili TaxID=1026970 RepID=A0A8C6R9A4_NANGA
IRGRSITWITEFILLGFSDFPRITALMDSHLHTPMHFFLSNLSFIDLCFVSSPAPNVLSHLFKGEQTISFVGSMAYDRYAVICYPLLYVSIMSPTLCVWMVLGSYVAGLTGSSSQTCALLQLNFCGPNVIRHFFCDISQLVHLSCTGKFFAEVLLVILTMMFGMANAFAIMISCVHIIFSMVKITSAKGRSKAFSTCASHLTAVSLFYGSGVVVYLLFSSGGSFNFDRFESRLRNNEIKDVKRFQKTGSC